MGVGGGRMNKKLLKWLKDEIEGAKLRAIYKATNMVLNVWKKEDFHNWLIELTYCLGQLKAFEEIYDKLNEEGKEE